MILPRWLNPFAHTALHEWRIRLGQCLFMVALPWIFYFFLWLLGIAK